MRLFFTLVFFCCLQPLRAQVSADNPFKLVNSAYDEQSPVISPDGSTLFFTVGNHPQNIGGKRDPGDIWISRRIGTDWSAPIHGGALLNDRAYNAVAGMSSNGEQLFLHGHYSSSGNVAKSQGIAVSNKIEHGWSRPINISIPYFTNKSGMLCGTVTGGGTVFIFSAETYGTYGVDDLYVSLKVNEKWTEPKNLGPTINTQFQELSPSVSADSKTLYFSSNGRKGKGSFDVYSSVRTDDTWTSWSVPVNLGDNINSPGRELYYRPHAAESTAIFTSTINSDGYGDIKTSGTGLPPPKKDSVVLAKHPVDTVRIVQLTADTAVHAVPNQVKVYGKVLNSTTGEPVEAQIAFIGPDRPQQKTTSSAEGYRIDIPASDKYDITIEARGYVSTMEKLDVHTYEMKELEMNFRLQPVAVGTTVNLKNVLFAQAKTDILPESFPELDLVVNFLQSNPNVRIELSGHTDNRGVHADNIKLSQQRVNKVKDYLVGKGVDAKRISGRGYGGTKPIASNETEASRRMNRRVEFTIKKF